MGKKKKKKSSKAKNSIKKQNTAPTSVKDSEILAEAESSAAEETEKAEIKEPAVEEPPVPREPEIAIPYDPDFSEEDFSASVKELKAEDITMPEEKNIPQKGKKKISKVTNVIQIALLVICGTVAVVCLYLLGENLWGKIKGQEIYSDTQNRFDGFTLEDSSPNNSRHLAYIGSDAPLLTLFERIDAGKSAVNDTVGGKYDEQLSQMKASLSALKSQYKDIYGWIYVPETNINHPIVRCDDNNYYLNHAHTGEYLPIGAIFADLTTKDLVTDNYNTVIYGHNVVSTGQSSMFHDVEKFLDTEFFNSHNIYIYTLDGAFIFQPVAIYDTVADDFYFKTVFNTENEFLKFAQEKVSFSNIYTGAYFASGDKMLTLSTCTNGAQDGRYALHAKLIEVID